MSAALEITDVDKQKTIVTKIITQFAKKLGGGHIQKLSLTGQKINEQKKWKKLDVRKRELELLLMS